MLPTTQEYKISLMIGQDSFRTLEEVEVIPNPNYPDEPWYSTGGLAIVFKLKLKDKLYALKCFYTEANERQERLGLIAAYLKENPSPYFVDFTYLENELWVETDNDEGQGYPVVLMEWVEGKTLDNYLEHICIQNNTSALKNLYFQFCNLAWWLQQQPIAHGDIKHDNLIVMPDGKLKLIDYDGVFVPALRGRKANEMGSPCYQHPQRDAYFFDKNLDDFSLLVLQITLLALQQQPKLFTEHYNGDGIILKDTDYQNFAQSSIKAILWQIPEVKIPLLLSQLQGNLNNLSAIDLMPLLQDVAWINWLVDKQEMNSKIDLSNNTFFQEDDFYRKLLDKSKIKRAIDFALNARMEYDMYYDPFDIDIFKIFKNEASKNLWSENLVNKIYTKISTKDLTFDVCSIYEFPKNENENRVNYYMKFEDYVIRYLLGLIIYEFKSELVSINSFNYNDDIFSLVKTPENDRPPAKWIKWIESNFFNGNYQYMAHFDVKNFFNNVDHEILLTTISNKIRLPKDSFFYQILKSNLAANNVKQENQHEGERGLIIQALDRFFADVYLKIIDDVFLDDKRIVYNRKVDDIVILFNDYSIYGKTLELIENKLSSIKLKLNTQKTELLDLSNLDNKVDKFFDRVVHSYSDGSHFDVILLNIQIDFKMGKAKRVFKWQMDMYANYEKYIKRIAPHWEDNDTIERRDVYGEEIRTIGDDFSIIALPNEWELFSDHLWGDENKIEFVRFMLESKLSVAMKVRLIKENFNLLEHSFSIDFFEKNDYYLYVLLNCIIQDFAISDQKDFANINRGSIVERFCSDSIYAEKIEENKILKEVFDYLQLNKEIWYLKN